MELIIVITILAILVTLALLYYGNLTDQARRVALRADLNAVDKATALYESKYNKLPTVGSPSATTVELDDAVTDANFGVDNTSELPDVFSNDTTGSMVKLEVINFADPNLMAFMKKTTYLLQPGHERGNVRGAGKIYIVTDSPMLASGDAPAAAGANTLRLEAADAAGGDEYYDGAIIYITAGTGIGQSRTITAYDDAPNPTVTVDRDWDIIPALNDTYEIYAPIRKGDIVMFQTATDDNLKIYESDTVKQLIYRY